MKQILVLLILATCFSPAEIFADTLTPKDFQYCAEVEGTLKAETLYQIHIPDEIIAKANTGFEDLRVFDISLKEVPWVMIENIPPHETVETYPLEITGYDNDGSSAIVSMKLPEKHRPISALDLKIVDKDFKKRISLSGSSDGKTWQPVTEDSIYDFSSQVKVRKTKIEFSKTDYRYFRLKLADFKTVSGGTPTIKLKYEGLDFSVNGVPKRDLRIHAVEGRTQLTSEKKPVYDRKIFSNPASVPDKDGNTVIILHAELPIDRITFDIANPYYYRTVTVYGSNTGKDDSYRHLSSQVIYRFPLSSDQHEEKRFIDQRIPKHAYYKLVITNKNNPPLEMKGIELSWVQQNLYFIALKNNERYSLCFGNQLVKKPDYDIANFINQNTLSRNPFERVELATQRASGGPRPELFGGFEKNILKIIVVLLVMGIGVWLYTLMKKAPKK
jgi:hypothetical protein